MVEYNADYRIKSLSKKITDNTGRDFPIGSQGKYIDMSSDLDLEEQLKLGSPASVKIYKNTEGDKILIRQEYNDSRYLLETTFDNFEENNIITSQNNSDTIIIAQTSSGTQPSYLINRINNSKFGKIKKVLYYKDNDNSFIIHQKTITIEPDNILFNIEQEVKSL